MMRMLRLGAALTLLAATVSCARSAGGGAGGSGTDGAGVAGSRPGVVSSTRLPPPSLDASGLPPAMRPNVAVPDRRVSRLTAVRWTRAVPAAGRQLQVQYTITGRGDCSALGRVDVAETDREVTVTVLVGPLPGAHCSGAQPELAASVLTVVTLAAPLGNRTVRDGAAR